MPRIGETKPYQLYNCDCFELFAKLKTQSVDMVLVDPPYGTTQCKWDSVIPLERMWIELGRVTKLDAAIIVMANQPFTSFLVCSNPKLFRYAWTWNKVNRVTGFLDAKKRPLRVVEDVLVFYRSQPTYNPQMTQGQPYKTTHGIGKNRKDTAGVYGTQVSVTRYRSDGRRYPQNLINIKGDERGTVGRIHPTQKPIALMEYLTSTYSDPGDLVLDFAMGSGTTGVACGRLGRRFIGCDNDVEHGYFEIAKKRIEEAYRA